MEASLGVLQKRKEPESVAVIPAQELILAVTYVPAPFPTQYHRPSEA